MLSFLIVYDTVAGKRLQLLEFPQRAQALQARFEAERIYGSTPGIEVVVLVAESIEALEQTHARYFKTPSQLLVS